MTYFRGTCPMCGQTWHIHRDAHNNTVFESVQYGAHFLVAGNSHICPELGCSGKLIDLSLVDETADGDDIIVSPEPESPGLN